MAPLDQRQLQVPGHQPCLLSRWTRFSPRAVPWLGPGCVTRGYLVHHILSEFPLKFKVVTNAFPFALTACSQMEDYLSRPSKSSYPSSACLIGIVCWPRLERKSCLWEGFGSKETSHLRASWCNGSSVLYFAVRASCLDQQGLK